MSGDQPGIHLIPIEVFMRIALVSDSPIASLRRPLTEYLDAQRIVPRYTVIEDACGDFSEAATHLHEVQPQVTVLYTQVESLVPDLFEVETFTAPVALRRRICDAALVITHIMLRRVFADLFPRERRRDPRHAGQLRVSRERRWDPMERPRGQ